MTGSCWLKTNHCHLNGANARTILSLTVVIYMSQIQEMSVYMSTVVPPLKDTPERIPLQKGHKCSTSTVNVCNTPLTKGYLSNKDRIVWQKGYICQLLIAILFSVYYFLYACGSASQLIMYMYLRFGYNSVHIVSVVMQWIAPTATTHQYKHVHMALVIVSWNGLSSPRFQTTQVCVQRLEPKWRVSFKSNLTHFNNFSSTGLSLFLTYDSWEKIFARNAHTA